MMLLLLGIAIHSTFLKWKNDISRRPKKIHRNRPPSIGAGCGRLGSSHYGMAYHPSSALETPHQFSALDGNKSTSQPKKCPFWGGNKSLDCGWRSWFIYIWCEKTRPMNGEQKILTKYTHNGQNIMKKINQTSYQETGNAGKLTT